MINVVHPAYHCLPNGGHGSFLPSGNRRLSCDRVLATTCNGQDIFVRSKNGAGLRYIQRDM